MARHLLVLDMPMLLIEDFLTTFIIGNVRHPSVCQRWRSNDITDKNMRALLHTSAKLIEIKVKFLQPRHSPHGKVRQMESNETPHTP